MQALFPDLTRELFLNMVRACWMHQCKKITGKTFYLADLLAEGEATDTSTKKKSTQSEEKPKGTRG